MKCCERYLMTNYQIKEPAAGSQPLLDDLSEHWPAVGHRELFAQNLKTLEVQVVHGLFSQRATFELVLV